MNMRVSAAVALLVLALATPALGNGGGVPADRFVYIPPETWCSDGAGGFEYPVLYAYTKRARLGPVAPASCARINGYTARSALHLKCERAGTWSPPRTTADPAFAALVLPYCHPGTSQDFR